MKGTNTPGVLSVPAAFDGSAVGGRKLRSTTTLAKVLPTWGSAAWTTIWLFLGVYTHKTTPCTYVYARCIYVAYALYVLRRLAQAQSPWFVLRVSTLHVLVSKARCKCVRRTRYDEEDPHPLFLYTRIRCFCLRVQEVKLVSTTCLMFLL